MVELKVGAMTPRVLEQLVKEEQGSDDGGAAGADPKAAMKASWAAAVDPQMFPPYEGSIQAPRSMVMCFSQPPPLPPDVPKPSGSVSVGASSQAATCAPPEASTSKAAAIQTVPRGVLSCANPNCWLLVHRNPLFGGYCCKKCHWRYKTNAKSKKHGQQCARAEAPEGAPCACDTPPAEPLKGPGIEWPSEASSGSTTTTTTKTLPAQPINNISWATSSSDSEDSDITLAVGVQQQGLSRLISSVWRH